MSVVQRFAPPGLLEGSLRICRGPPPGVCAGAAPIVNSAPPPGAPVEVDGASWVGALKGEEGDDTPKVVADPKPPKGGRVLFVVAGDAGCEPNENGVDDTVGKGAAPKAKGDDWANVEGLPGAEEG